MKLFRKDEPLIVNTIKILIYGEPGSWKTSIGFSASKPILFDFDNGAYRTAYRGDSFQISTWDEVASLHQKEIDEFDTIVIDTAGCALDMIIAYLQRTGKNLTNRSGIPNQRGWGEAKAVFVAFLRKITSLGKDVVVIAHNKKERDDDMIINRPDIQGGSLAELVKKMDQVGFLDVINGERFIDFSPDARHLGKDSAGIGKVPVHSLDNEPDFLDVVIQKIKESINNSSESNRLAAKELAEFVDRINSAKTADDFALISKDIEKSTVKDKVRPNFRAAMERHGVLWDKATGNFVDPEPQHDEQYYREAVDKCETKAQGAELLADLAANPAITGDAETELHAHIFERMESL